MLRNKLKKIEGTVLAIGLDEKLLDVLEKNNKIEECYLLNSGANSNDGRKGYSKTINIRKIKRIFRKKSFDYIICNFEQLKPYLRSFIKNSIYLNRKTIYFYNIEDFDLDELQKRYERYESVFEVKKEIATIDNSKARTNRFKNVWYYLRDLGYDTLEYISKILVN